MMKMLLYFTVQSLAILLSPVVYFFSYNRTSCASATKLPSKCFI